MRATILAVILGLGLGSPGAQAAKRVALVIGNAAYSHAPQLGNPLNDAGDVSTALGKLGFEVVDGRNLDESGMRRTIKLFSERLVGADVGLFFYAGHGLQVNGTNYLVPIDAKLENVAGLDFELIRLELVHRTMERETKTNVIFLDACRDNPLSRNLARAMGTRSSQIGKGLAIVESGVGTLISFSTQPGNVALDGKGRNSPFTAALVKRIAEPREDLTTLLIQVRNDVMAATGDRQVPWEHSALRSKFYFAGVPPPQAAAPSAGPSPEQIEQAFWASVKDSTNPAELSSYIERYPKGQFVGRAREVIERLKAVEAAAQEQDRRRRTEAEAASEVRRLEDERTAREAALAAERKQAEDAKNGAEVKRLQERQRAELRARADELAKAREEARLAAEAAKAAEERKLAAVKAAEDARKAASKAKERTTAAAPAAKAPRATSERSCSSVRGECMGNCKAQGQLPERCQSFCGSSYSSCLSNGVFVRAAGPSDTGLARK